MKVLFIHNTLPEYRIHFFCELSKLVELDILITEKDLANSVYNLKIDIPKELSIKYISNKAEISYIIKNKKYDITVLPPLDNFYQLDCAFRTIFLCKRKSIKTIYWTEKWEAPISLQPIKKRIKNFIQSQVIAFFAKEVDRCIAAGSQSKNYLIKCGVIERNINVAIDSSKSPKSKINIDIRSKYNISQKGKIILFLGRIVKRKGCDVLINAFEKISNDKSLYLLVCGEGPELNRIRDIVKSRGINNVIFTGKIEPNIRAEYFKQANVFVLPSYTLDGTIEAWGLTVNESLEQGTAVVASTAVGAVYDLSDGKCCIKVKENDVDSLVNGLLRVLNDIDLEKLCKELYNKYSIEKMAESFYNAFVNCVNDK